MGFDSRVKKLSKQDQHMVRKFRNVKKAFRHSRQGGIPEKQHIDESFAAYMWRLKAFNQKEVGGLGTDKTMPKKHKGEIYEVFKQRRKEANKRRRDREKNRGKIVVL